MKIKTVTVNNKQKCLEISTAKDDFHLPFSKLRLQPTPENRIDRIKIDPELAKQAITYTLESGAEDSIHLDAFLAYHKDADYMLNMTLYELTVKALELIEHSGLGKREIARKLHTSPTQLYRLMDTTNYKKTIDQMFKLIHHLGGVLKVAVKHSKEIFISAHN
jgi:hypothetical protein